MTFYLNCIYVIPELTSYIMMSLNLPTPIDRKLACTDSFISRTAFVLLQILFFGDSLRSDVFPSKTYAGWDTVLILEEMLAEQWQGGQLLHKDADHSPQSKKKKSVVSCFRDRINRPAYWACLLIQML